MENASKALIIAGGILLAMLILSLIVLVDSSISDMRRTKVDQDILAEKNAFNAQFEAYNKKIMYGADVISVINKAADNNNLLMYKNESDSAAVGFVNIIVITDYKYKTTAFRYDKSKKPGDYGYMEPEEVPIDDTLKNIVGATLYKGALEINESNVLGYWKNKTLIPDNNFKKFFDQSAENHQVIDYVDGSGKHWDYYVYSALYNFKIDKFTCSNVEYDADTGKIRQLTFTRVEKK